MEIAAQIALPEHGLAEEDSTAARDARFTALVGRHTRFCFRVAYAVLRNVEDAEDLVQELFLKLYRSRAWENMRDEKAFLARSAWRLAVDRLRKRKPQTFDSQIEGHIEARQLNPEQAAIASNWRDTVHRMVDALPEDLRQALALSTIDGLDAREIAKMMGIPEGTVRTRQMRARVLLKSKLAAHIADRPEKQNEE
jgi:RNA polymerase sigma-70 factor (ECF subfamily)